MACNDRRNEKNHAPNNSLVKRNYEYSEPKIQYLELGSHLPKN